MWTLICCILTQLIIASRGQPLLEGEGCVVGNRTYAVGENFHPWVTTPEREFLEVCLDCTCFNLVPLCQETQCPEPECEHPVRINGTCCPICIVPDISADYSQCVYNGLLIEHGETFHPPASASQASEEQNATSPHCNECTCDDGAVTCKDVSEECPLLDCEEDDAVVVNGTCCPVCSTSPQDPPQEAAGCTSSDGRFFAEGESWHPLFPLIGPIPCINCTCTDSQEKCLKLPCPSEPLPPCDPSDPVPDVVLCCPKCQIVASRSTSEAVPTTTPSAPPAVVIVPPNLIPNDRMSVMPTPCSPAHSVKVWRHRTAEAAAAEFTEDGGEGMVRIYKWTPTGSGYLKQEEEVSSEDFSRAHYNLLGWTIARRANGLRSRESKRERINNCTTNCANLVTRLLRPTSKETGC